MSGMELRPDLVCLRTGIVNVYFYGLPGAGDRGWVLIDAGLHGFVEVPISGTGYERADIEMRLPLD